MTGFDDDDVAKPDATADDDPPPPAAEEVLSFDDFLFDFKRRPKLTYKIGKRPKPVPSSHTLLCWLL